MISEYCIVLGSKPQAPLPDIDPVHIFTANAAAALAPNYRSTGAAHTAIVSSLQFKNETVFNKVINARPAEIIIRGHKIKNNPDPVDNIPVTYINGNEQFRLESKYFGFYNLRAFLLRPGINKIKSLIRHLQGTDYIFGTSTGLWSILYALDKYPEKKVIVAGIGLQGGGHFYGKDEFRNEDGIKDYLIAKNLKRKARERVFTTDAKFAERTGATFWDGPVFNNETAN